MNRRQLLSTVPLLAVAACTSTTVNGVTTVTINVAQAVAYGNAASAAVDAFLALPGVAKAIGTKYAEVQGAIAKVGAIGAAVQAAAGSSQTFTFDTNKPPAFIGSLGAALGLIRTDVTAAMTAIGSGATSQVTAYYQGVLAILNAIAALFMVPSA